MRFRNTVVVSPVAHAMLPALAVLALLAGCVTTTATPARPVAIAEEAPPRVYFYPTQGQSAEQQDRDRYECYAWAVQQTGFDPGRRPLPPQERVAVVPSRAPGENTISTAIAGAIIGAVVSSPGHAGGGAIIGATAGGLLGAAADEAQAGEVRQIQGSQGNSRYRREAAEYRRAMSACLEGRGYTVK